jgi:hypothetical protein
MDTTKHIQGVETFITQLAGTGVIMREVKPGAWVVVPVERSHLHSRVWRMLRSGHQSGVGGTAIEEALLFARAVGVGGQRRVAPKHRAKAWLLDQLASDQSFSVSQIRSNADSSGVTWSSVDRAARELGVIRQKCGLRGGWTWRMPALPKIDS